jgi:aminoglycoside phosphotransferase (APT) family kinase protein
MRALSFSDVPVPTVAWYEPDPAVLGMPFYFMSRLRAETQPLLWYGPSPRQPALAGALAAIHCVDWRGLGLDFLLPAPRPDSPLAAELVSWRERATRYRYGRHPLLERLERFLLANEPPSARFALIHGDPNPGNYLVRGNDVAGVVDWELAAIGDPRSDLGFYAALDDMFGGGSSEGGRTLLSHAYEQVTGAALTDLPYYEAWGLYRMLVVMGGWGIWGGYYGLEAIEYRLASLLGPSWGV